MRIRQRRDAEMEKRLKAKIVYRKPQEACRTTGSLSRCLWSERGSSVEGRAAWLIQQLLSEGQEAWKCK